MTTKKAMQQQGLRYFSSLTPKQKDKVTFFVLKLKNGLTNLPDGLSKTILSNLDYDFETREKLQKSKIFRYNGEFYPLNINEFKPN